MFAGIWEWEQFSTDALNAELEEESMAAIRANSRSQDGDAHAALWPFGLPTAPPRREGAEARGDVQA